MTITAGNYEQLKGFSLWLTEQLHNETLARLNPESHPRSIIEQYEKHSMATARKSVQMIIGDLLEETELFTDRQIAICDEALLKQNFPTLTQVRAEFGRKVRSILRRGRIRNEGDYYALRNVADALPEAEREKAWAMIDLFMTAKDET